MVFESGGKTIDVEKKLQNLESFEFSGDHLSDFDELLRLTKTLTPLEDTELFAAQAGIGPADRDIQPNVKLWQRWTIAHRLWEKFSNKQGEDQKIYDAVKLKWLKFAQAISEDLEELNEEATDYPGDSFEHSVLKIIEDERSKATIDGEPNEFFLPYQSRANEENQDRAQQ